MVTVKNGRWFSVRPGTKESCSRWSEFLSIGTAVSGCEAGYPAGPVLQLLVKNTNNVWEHQQRRKNTEPESILID
jgi:hypothetical protein